MELSPYITSLTIIIIAAFLIIIGLALVSCLKFRANIRLFIGGLFGYLLTDIVSKLFHDIAKSSAGLSTLYERNYIVIQIFIFLIQGFVFAFAAYYCTKLLRRSNNFHFKHAFAVAAGMASFRVYLSCITQQIANLALLRGYRAYLNGTGSEGELSADDLALVEETVAEITETTVPELWLSLLEIVLLFVFIIAIAFLAATPLANGRMYYCAISAGIFFIYHAVLAALNTYVSIWAGIAFALLMTAGSVYYLNTQYRQIVPPRRLGS